MQKKQAFDIVNEVLEDCILAFPVSSFIISLYKRYLHYGTLSKKQLQGLYSKAEGIAGYPPAKLATLEALINKMPTRYKTELPMENKPVYEKDEETGSLISKILDKYPEHKRVLFLKAKYDNNETLAATDLNDLKRIAKMIR